jgi:hypothetical protein
MGCQSLKVDRVFLTPPKIGNVQHKRFDAGMRNSADRMGIGNFADARPGETSFTGRGELGTELLWGNDVQKNMGMSFDQLSTQAAAPLTVQRRDGSTETLTDNNALRQVALESGITMNRIPSAERTVHKADQKSLKGGA